jgi:glucose-6-phosphate isomerase
VIGIGGSSLGAKALQQAVAPQPPLTGTPRLHFVENIDPCFLQGLLPSLDAGSSAVLCISKSGGTIETVVQYLILRDWLARQLGGKNATRHQWVITDPKRGWLRELAEREGLPSLSVPPQVGGRYSVLSPVGLVPLATLGIDIGALLQGAADNAARCANADVTANPALEIAALCVLLDTRRSKRTAVMMPYVNRLQLFVDWYCQLWAESLGKWDRARPGSTPAGTLPVRAMGAVDQHSQLQMYLESRQDKFFTFIELETCAYDLPVPLDSFDAAHFPFLADRSIAEVIDAEFRATRQVITDAGHPNMTIRLPVLTAHVLGQLIDLYQRITIYAGLLYGINPLDQPSVEIGKRLAIDYLRGAPR